MAKYYLYSVTSDFEQHYGKKGKLNTMLVPDACELFTSEKDAIKAMENLNIILETGQSVTEMKIVQYERERNGTYQYEMNFKTYESLRNADNCMDYFYIVIKLHENTLEGYGYNDMIPASCCKKSKGAMTRFCNKNNGKSRWHYEVYEVPIEQIIMDK